jgi:hypothetical protein
MTSRLTCGRVCGAARTAYLLTGAVHHAELLQDALARVADRWPALGARVTPTRSCGR